jgi:pyruvate kinase
LTAQDRVSDAPGEIDGVLPLPADWLVRLVPGDEVTFVDTRGRNRHLEIVTTAPDGCLAEARQTAYVISGTPLTIWRGGDSVGVADTAAIGTLPAREQALALTIGDRLVLTRDLDACQWATLGDDGSVVEPARIGCTLPEVFGAAKPGQPIWFDDGKIGGVIESTQANELTVKITHAPAGGARLRAGKGINLPETRLSLSAMTDKDSADLAFAARHADMVALSFVQTASDVEAFYQYLRQLKPAERRIGLVLKIETRRAFANLPELVLAAMRGSPVGIMIARGDLAVECGFERLAEVQEEILWLAEAAHLPVIWATQVLETEAKTGQPTRAEITDAAMGQRAECVMLNKGPYIGDTVRTLDDILCRMTAHQSKKRPLLRRLRAWDGVSP